MRTTVKYRLSFLAIAMSCYCLGFTFIPDTTTSALGLAPVITASFTYFLLLPVLYWFLIIKAGKQKPWKLLIIFSLSSVIARYSFPEDVAQYFDFILWLRYPIIAVLLIIEFYLMFVIVKGLWQARNLSGDPRIGAIEKYDDEKKQGLALTFATEPASWYYAIPNLSKNHIKALNKITLLSGKAWHFLTITITLIIAATISYKLLVNWSELVATIAATFILYGFILMTANYRLSRHYSIYIQSETLIINNSIFNFMPIPLAEIKSVTLNDVVNNKIKMTKTNNLLKVGHAKQHNIKITFKQPIKYWGMMGAFVESFEQILLNVEQPNEFINTFAQINSPQQDVA